MAVTALAGKDSFDKLNCCRYNTILKIATFQMFENLLRFVFEYSNLHKLPIFETSYKHMKQNVFIYLVFFNLFNNKQ